MNQRRVEGRLRVIAVISTSSTHELQTSTGTREGRGLSLLSRFTGVLEVINAMGTIERTKKSRRTVHKGRSTPHNLPTLSPGMLSSLFLICVAPERSFISFEMSRLASGHHRIMDGRANGALVMMVLNKGIERVDLDTRSESPAA
jgi:hypothetical protein